MKNIECNQCITKRDLAQEIADLEEDLLVVLEAHIDEMDVAVLYHHILKFMTIALYNHAENHKEAFKILQTAVDEGIKNHVDKYKEK